MEGGGEYPQELREIAAAALALVCLKHRKFENVPRTHKRSHEGQADFDPISRKPKRIHCNKEEEEEEEEIMRNPILAKIKLFPMKKDEIANFIIGDGKSSIIRLFPTLHGLIGECSKPVQKQLTKTDVKRQQARLLLHKEGAEECLLPLLNKDEVIVQGIDVTVYDSAGKTFNMQFKKWAKEYHVLAGSGWLKFLNKHNLKEVRDTVSLWMFRNLETRKPCFAIFCKSLQEIASVLA